MLYLISWKVKTFWLCNCLFLSLLCIYEFTLKAQMHLEGKAHALCRFRPLVCFQTAYCLSTAFLDPRRSCWCDEVTSLWKQNISLCITWVVVRQCYFKMPSPSSLATCIGTSDCNVLSLLWQLCQSWPSEQPFLGQGMLAACNTAAEDPLCAGGLRYFMEGNPVLRWDALVVAADPVTLRCAFWYSQFRKNLFPLSCKRKTNHTYW